MDELIKNLAAIEGVDSVESDDFDSTHVNIFIFLKARHRLRSSQRVLAFEKHLTSLRAKVKKVAGKDIRFLDSPKKQYYTSFGDRYEDGYDIDYFKIEVPHNGELN